MYLPLHLRFTKKIWYVLSTFNSLQIMLLARRISPYFMFYITSNVTFS
jgi:hypothetical protein